MKNISLHHSLPAMAAILLSFCSATSATADESSADLAKKLSNPVAALISVPFQFNYDNDIGTAKNGTRQTLNIQPVIPIELNNDWNVISRTIVPLVWQDEIYPGAGSQSGTGDIVQSVFFSPKAPTSDGWIWGAGPVLLLPTGSNDLLSAKKWGAGPTGVALKQDGPLTYGILANHLWSYAGDSNRADISMTFLQPFFSYTTSTAWTYTLNTESTYDWKNNQWSVPINGVVSKVTKVSGQLVSLGGGVRYWADGPESGPHGFGARLIMTFLFPK